MIGLYVRVERDGHWVSLDITEMTKEEIESWLKEKSDEFVRGVVVSLVNWVKENVREE